MLFRQENSTGGVTEGLIELGWVGWLVGLSISMFRFEFLYVF